MTENGRSKTRRIVRELAVNVAGNLLAAVIIYGLAVAGGYIQGRPLVLGYVLAGAGPIALFLFIEDADDTRYKWPLYIFSSGAFLLGIMIIAIENNS